MFRVYRVGAFARGAGCVIDVSIGGTMPDKMRFVYKDGDERLIYESADAEHAECLAKTLTAETGVRYYTSERR